MTREIVDESGECAGSIVRGRVLVNVMSLFRKQNLDAAPSIDYVTCMTTTNLSTSEIKRARQIIATGATYENRAALAALGGRWDAAAKAWVIPATATMSERGALAQATYDLGKRGVRWEAR